MIVRRIACALLIACTAPASAQTNPPPLETPAGKPFLHAHNGVTLPARLSGLERAAAREVAPPAELDAILEGRETSRIKTWGTREIWIPPSQTK